MNEKRLSTAPAQAMPGRDWLEGMVSAWRTNAAEHEGEGWRTSADAFRTCAADLERALRLNPREALPCAAVGPDHTAVMKQALAALDGVGDGRYEAEYDGRMEPMCLGCNYDERKGHADNCDFIAAHRAAAALRAALSHPPVHGIGDGNG